MDRTRNDTHTVNIRPLGRNRRAIGQDRACQGRKQIQRNRQNQPAKANRNPPQKSHFSGTAALSWT